MSRPIVSDTGPLHYLILIEASDVLPKLFGRVLIPDAVAIELSHPGTPSKVRSWLDVAPTWLERRPVSGGLELPGRRRGAGERAAVRWPWQFGRS
jgi:hypothetical protein